MSLQTALTTRKRRVTAVVVAGTLVAVGGGGAFAYWTSQQGSGSGSASTGDSVAFVVTSVAGDDPLLTPGGPAQVIDFTVTNPGTGSQSLTLVTARILEDGGTTWNDVTGCTAADYSVAAPVITYGQIAGGGELDGTVSVTMLNSEANQDACQDATVPLWFETNPVVN